MNEDKSPVAQDQSQPAQSPAELTPPPVMQPAPQVSHPAQGTDVQTFAQKVNHIMALVLIFSGISFVLIAILAIWQVFGPDAGDIVWRALGSLGAIALGALIVSVASKLVDERQK